MTNLIYCPHCATRLTSRFVDGRSRLFCFKCNKPIYENPVPSTASVVINENQEILLVKRNIEPKKGEWCLPGGFIELYEKSEECCLRELKEETNLEGEIKRLAGVYLSKSPIYKSVLVIGYSIKNIRGEIRPGDDSEEVRFFSFKEMPKIAFDSHQYIFENVLKLREIDKKDSICKFKNLNNLGAYVITSCNHIEIVKKACKAGANIVQYRDKIFMRKLLLENAIEIRNITNKYNSIFIVNDFIDIALMSQADGVHLGQDDIPVLEARKITPKNFIIGVSTHSLRQAIKAEKEGADYIGIGPVFATPTKNYPSIGLNKVKEVLKAVSIPVVGIGGLNLNNLSELKDIGLKNFAMIREFQNNTEQAVNKINSLFT
jgi:thiamine-phosphate diphosphorylase